MRESGERRLLYDARRRDADAGRELSAALLSLRSQRLSVSVNPCGRCDSGVTVMLEMPLQRVLQILAAFRIPDLVDLHDKPLFVIRSGFLFLFFKLPWFLVALTPCKPLLLLLDSVRRLNSY